MFLGHRPVILPENNNVYSANRGSLEAVFSELRLASAHQQTIIVVTSKRCGEEHKLPQMLGNNIRVLVAETSSEIDRKKIALYADTVEDLSQVHHAWPASCFAGGIKGSRTRCWDPSGQKGMFAATQRSTLPSSRRPRMSQNGRDTRQPGNS